MIIHPFLSNIPLLHPSSTQGSENDFVVPVCLTAPVNMNITGMSFHTQGRSGSGLVELAYLSERITIMKGGTRGLTDGNIVADVALKAMKGQRNSVSGDQGSASDGFVPLNISVNAGDVITLIPNATGNNEKITYITLFGDTVADWALAKDLFDSPNQLTWSTAPTRERNGIGALGRRTVWSAIAAQKFTAAVSGIGKAGFMRAWLYTGDGAANIRHQMGFKDTAAAKTFGLWIDPSQATNDLFTQYNDGSIEAAGVDLSSQQFYMVYVIFWNGLISAGLCPQRPLATSPEVGNQTTSFNNNLINLTVDKVYFGWSNGGGTESPAFDMLEVF